MENKKELDNEQLKDVSGGGGAVWNGNCSEKRTVPVGKPSRGTTGLVDIEGNRKDGLRH